jgi:hypothetical protein
MGKVNNMCMPFVIARNEAILLNMYYRVRLLRCARNDGHSFTQSPFKGLGQITKQTPTSFVL